MSESSYNAQTIISQTSIKRFQTSFTCSQETMVREALNKKAEETKDEAASDPATENLDGDFEGEEEEPGEADEAAEDVE